ncbi:MAG TPA: PKD domain-containing protein, partial [Gemmatimonadales bacterium]|nr:PKD domain-containing protein [Gemmatimonadales bacterium]
WAYQILWGDGTTSTGSTPSQGAFRVSHTYAQVGLDSVRVTVTDAGGTAGADTLAVVVEPPGTPETLLIAGDIAECAASGAQATATLLDGLPGVVFTAGDNTYPNGAAADYASCYAPAWGRHRNRTYATLGNHDYGLGNAFGSWDYFGSGAGDRGNGYYSVDLGSSWHIVVLNSNYTFVPTALGSAQEQWLRADLAAASGKCIVALWHHPKFYSSTEGPLSAGTITDGFWADLYAAHADLIVNGHMHSYERFAQVNPAGNPDPNGIREIIAGTGGAWPDAPSTYFWPTSQAYISGVWGVLQLTLNTGSYSWHFLPADGDTASDSGSTTCHNVAPPTNTPPTAQAGGPYSGAEGTAITFDGSGSSAAGGGILTYAWNFGDGTTASGVSPTHTYVDNGTYAVTLTVTDGSGLTSAAATSTATISNVAPSVNAGSALSALTGNPLSLSVTFSDLGALDGAWTYSINWGDGSAPTTGSATAQSVPITASHTYAAAGSDTIQVTVTDKDGGTGAGGTIATVVAANRAPTAVAGGPISGVEGAALTFNGSGSSDPDGDALTYAWTFGDGGTATGATPTHTYADNAVFTVTLTVTDSHGAASALASTTATIADVAPTVTAPAALAANVGAAVSLGATFTDPGANDAPWAYTINWGDGSLPTTGSAAVRGAVGGTHTYGAAGVFTATVTVTDKDGSGGSAQTTMTATQQQVASVTALVAGNIARCDRTNDEATEAVLDTIAGSVMVMGDNAYPNGTAANFQTCYNSSWGRVLARTYPVVGNHEYDSSATAAPYFAYFGAVAGNPSQGYYSFDLGAWHIVVLNSNSSFVPTAVGSAQETWLRSDLAATTKRCQLALFHHPRFYSTTSTSFSPTASVKPFWDDLYAAGAELIVNAHMQDYERFAPQTSAGVADPARGVREFVVGTGGAGLDAPNTLIIANSEARISGVYGVLKLTLADGSYSWQFLPVAGQSATDSGSGTCH